MLYVYLLLCSFFLCSCSTEPHNKINSLEILGRSDIETLSSRQPIYRMQIPEGWLTIIPAKELPLVDTTEPLLTLKKDDVTITFHNFPVSDITQRVPPIAQITRWKKQFRELYEITVVITPYAVSGFTGLQFEAKGTQKGEHRGILAWSMQLTPELFQKLPDSAVQQKADWTLKAVGPAETVDLLHQEISDLARSIELLTEIPQR